MDEPNTVEVVGGATDPILGKGSLYLRNEGLDQWIKITNVYYVPSARSTFLSPSRFGKHGVITTLSVNSFTLRSNRHGTLLTGVHCNAKYVLEPLEMAPTPKSTREPHAPATCTPCWFASGRTTWRPTR